MLFLLKSSLVKEELTERAWERNAAPDSPIWLQLKSKLVKEELTARNWERGSTPEPKILFLLKSKIVNEELTAKTWKRDATPESLIWLSLNFNWVKLRCSPKVWSKLACSDRLLRASNTRFETSSAATVFNLRLVKLMFAATLLTRDSAVFLLFDTNIPIRNTNTWYSSLSYLWSVTTDSQLIFPLISLQARKKPEKNSWKLLWENA